MTHATAYKQVPFEFLELKESRDAWTFSGYASTFGNVDLGGDVVMPGAFADSLKLRPKPKLLWSHDRDEPIGVVQSMTEDDRGLRGEWKLSKTTRGQDAYTLLKDGAIDSLSIGYIPSESEFTDDGVRKLKGIDLLEVSLVSIPMNEEATVLAVKAADAPLAAHLDRVLADVRLLTDRCAAVASLRADEGRKAGASVGRMRADMPTLLKALAAEVEGLLLEDPASDAELNPPGNVDDPATLSITQLRLRIAHKRLDRRTDQDDKAVWTTAYINDLPDSAFAVILAGGSKVQGKTEPRSLRKLPHHNAEGSLDKPHLRNALSREPQADMPASAHSTASSHLNRHAKAEGVGST